jgi:protein TonB
MLTLNKKQFKSFVGGVAFVSLPVLAAVFPGALRAEALHVSEQEAQHAVITKVAPQYPPIARQMNLAGRVEVELYVNAGGTVDKAQVVAGNPILGGAAVNAAKRWKFQPFQADGKASDAVVRLSFDFVK